MNGSAKCGERCRRDTTRGMYTEKQTINQSKRKKYQQKKGKKKTKKKEASSRKFEWGN